MQDTENRRISLVFQCPLLNYLDQNLSPVYLHSAHRLTAVLSSGIFPLNPKFSTHLFKLKINRWEAIQREKLKSRIIQNNQTTEEKNKKLLFENREAQKKSPHFQGQATSCRPQARRNGQRFRTSGRVPSDGRKTMR